MDAAAAVGQIIHVENALQVIATLMFTAYMFPKQATVTDNQEYDFIVVGAGSAGSVIAARLAECNFKVLLVEAGGDPPQESIAPGFLQYTQHTQNDWNYTTEYSNNTFVCHRTQTANLTDGRMLGGSSSLNFMFYVRGCPGDFAKWATAAKDSSWDWNGVLPYFMKSEKCQDQEILNSANSNLYHSTKGFLGVARQTSSSGEKFLESFKELGNDIILDINADKHLGYNYPMYTISDGVRQSTATTILSAMKNNKNLHVLKNTFVNKIIIDANKNAVGIEATKSDNKIIKLKATKEVIVSAGGINTPRLLMASGVGPADHLKSHNIGVISDLPVGKNFQAHSAFSIPIKLEKSNEALSSPDPRRFPFETISGYVALNNSNTCPDYQTFSFIVPNDSPSVMNLCIFDFGLKYEIGQKIQNAGQGSKTFFTTIVNLHPKSHGQVLLRSTKPKDPPRVVGGYLSDDRDLETFVDAAVKYIKILDTPYFKSVGAELVNLNSETGCSNHVYLSRDWWRCYVRCMMSSLYHYVGTCAMGSVVDSHLRVYGVNRLRVVDASIMPTIISANTNAACIMIGEKGADLIKQDYPCSSN